MRRALTLLVTLVCSCHTPPASPPSSPTRAAVAPSMPPEAGPDPAPPVSSNGAESEPVASVSDKPAEAEAEDAATPAAFGQPLRPGLYVFPDGLRIRVEQIAGCDFDTSVPCFGGTYRAHATLGKQEATVEWSTRSKVVLRHRIDVTQSDFTVRK